MPVVGDMGTVKLGSMVKAVRGFMARHSWWSIQVHL